MPNIYRVASPFTSRTVYYSQPTPGIVDLSPDRNQFITNNNTPPCDGILFQGVTWELLNSLDPVETPCVFQFKSDDTTCSGYISNTIFAEISINLFSTPNITEFEVFGEVFTQNNGPWPISLTDHEFFGPSYNVLDRVQSIINLINENANLNWRFVAYSTPTSPTSVIIKALFPGTQYNFNLGTTIKYSSSTGGPTNFDYNIASFDNNRGMRYQNYGYKMFLEIWEIDLEWLTVGSDAFPEFASAPKRLVTTLEQVWNPSNVFSFDVSKFFNLTKDISLYPQTPNPFFQAYSDQQIFFDPNVTKHPIQGYFLRWGEMFQGGLGGPTLGQIEGGIAFNGLFWQLTVSVATPGFLEAGQFIVSPGNPQGTAIQSQISGTPGGAGVYAVNPTITVAPGTTFDESLHTCTQDEVEINEEKTVVDNQDGTYTETKTTTVTTTNGTVTVDGSSGGSVSGTVTTTTGPIPATGTGGNGVTPGGTGTNTTFSPPNVAKYESPPHSINWEGWNSQKKRFAESGPLHVLEKVKTLFEGFDVEPVTPEWEFSVGGHSFNVNLHAFDELAGGVRFLLGCFMTIGAVAFAYRIFGLF